MDYLKERRLVLPVNADVDLIRTITAIEHLYLDSFKEEGESDIYFDLTEFPPKQIPKSYPPGNHPEFESVFTTGDGVLKRFQKRALNPSSVSNYRNYFLLGKSHGDADQIIPFLDKMVTMNRNFRVLTIDCTAQDPEYYRHRMPMVTLYATRGGKALVYFALEINSFPNHRDKEREMEKVLSRAVNGYKRIYSTAEPAIRDFNELLRTSF